MNTPTVKKSWGILPRPQSAAKALMVLGLQSFFFTSLAEAQTTRDPFKWPFSRSSFWNTPIGSNAVYVDANINSSPRTKGEIEYIVRSRNDESGWREVDAIVHGGFSSGNRCNGTTDTGKNLWLLDGFTVPDNGNNNVFTAIQTNGRTVREHSPGARCSGTGPFYGKWRGDKSIYGGGRGKGPENIGDGGHSGSGLSGYGGSIRVGEMFGSDPIRHAVKLTIYGNKWLYSPVGCSLFTAKRWPAYVNDSYAGCSGSSCKYNVNANTGMKMGVLLAVPPSVSKSSLGLETGPGSKLFDAFRDFGAYVVDDTCWDRHQINVEKAAWDEFKTVMGYDMNVNTSAGDASTAFHRDFNKIMKEVHFISNNSSSNVGGGGTPRVALAPPFKYEAEAVTRTASGASSSQIFDAGANNDRWIKLSADSTGDYIEFELESVYAASYDLKIRYKSLNSRGRFQASVGSTNIGGVKDQYSSSSSYKTLTVGSINFSSGGTKVVRFQVTGKNSSSSGYSLSFDQVWLEENGGSGGSSSSSSSSGALLADSDASDSKPGNFRLKLKNNSL